jgi:Tfp pilus assembly protein PilO
MLASVNAGGEISEDDPSVEEFRAVLDTLVAKCPNERQELADLAVSTHQAVTERGLEITLLKMMQDLSENIPPDLIDIGISCEIALGAYVDSEAPQ